MEVMIQYRTNLIDPMIDSDGSNIPHWNLMDKIRSLVLEMCGIDFDLILTKTLSKDTILKNEMNYDSDGTKWEDEMKKMR